MNIEQAKQIPLDSFLQRLGHEPVRRSGHQLWYISPFRDEATPSFKINRTLNAWYDFGAGLGGDIVDLVQRLERTDSVSSTLTRIQELTGQLPLSERMQNVAVSTDRAPASELVSLTPVHSKLLIAYMRNRGIDPKLAHGFVQEAHYRRGDDFYSALAFANQSEGFELRNPSFKGTLGAKDITVLSGNPDRILMFEGFFDFLTMVTMNGVRPDATVIVLNSVSMRSKAVEAIRKLNPTVVELHRDHDPAGEQLVVYLQDALPEVAIVDNSNQYDGYKDLNAWFTATSCVKSIRHQA